MTNEEKLKANYLKSKLTKIRMLFPEKPNQKLGETVGIITEEIHNEPMVWVHFPEGNIAYCVGINEFEVIE